MTTHWKAFLVVLAFCFVVFWIFPVGVETTNPLRRTGGAIGSAMFAATPALIGAGIGRMTRYGTASGMLNGAAVSVILVGLALYGYFNT